MSLFQRRVRNLMAAVQQKYLLPTCIVLLIVLVVLLYRQEDPTKFPVGLSGHGQEQSQQSQLDVLLKRRKSVPKAKPSACRPRSPEQLLALGSRQRTFFNTNQLTIPNYFLHFNSKVIKNIKDPSSLRLVFMHHNKAGGTSVKQCLRSIGEGEHLRVTQAITGFKRQRFHTQASQRQRYATFDILVGGYTAGICDEEFSKLRQCAYVTMLRHPLDRLLSSYFYCQRLPRDQLCASLAVNASSVTLAQWAQHQSGFLLAQLSYRPDNCRATGGDSLPCWLQMRNALQERSCSRADLVKLAHWVGDQLSNVFAALGMVDQMDLSMRMWEKISGLSFNKYCTGDKVFDQNKAVTKDDSSKDQLREKALADPVIQRAMELDTIIYEKALDIFRKQMAVFADMENKT